MTNLESGRIQTESADPESIAAVLSETELFCDVGLADLTDIASTIKRRRFKRGEVIYHQDDPPGSLFILLGGAVKVTLPSHDGSLLTLAWISKPGSTFGTISLLDENPRLETVIALLPSEAFAVDAEQLRQFLFGHPETAVRLLRSVAARWRATMEQLQDMAFLDIHGRLAKVLLNYARPARLPLGEEGPDLGHLSQGDFASLIGATRESVNKTLQFFVHQGWVEMQEGRIQILEPERLRRCFS